LWRTVSSSPLTSVVRNPSPGADDSDPQQEGRGARQSGGNSSSFTATTLNNVATGANELLVLNNATNEGLVNGAAGSSTFANALVNVASATTLAQALDLAVAQAAISQDNNANDAGFAHIAPNTGVIDWFQFQGNTYIVEAVNAGPVAASHPALAAGDAVVKIVGLVDLSASTFNTVSHVVGF